MTILHTESSLGWGGQEIRVFQDACSFRDEGYRILLAAPAESLIYKRMNEAGFEVFPFSFRWRNLWKLGHIIRLQGVKIINTHSSKDSWMGGVAARLFSCKVVRTRHLSTPVKRGLNSIVLYRYLADTLVTTCQITADILQKQSGQKKCVSIPTGLKIEGIKLRYDLREKFGISPTDFVVGTLCVLRSWKGVQGLLSAAALCQDLPITWLIVGDGPMLSRLKIQAKNLKKVIFTGHVEPPYEALAAMDIFTLLSTANEGVSQATIQAASLGKPLITSNVGGLPEVCLEGITGFITNSPQKTAYYVKLFYNDPELRETMGLAGKALVNGSFTSIQTFNKMKEVYDQFL
ncbi:MAG: glycosyltransferase family 4 protein [Chlamydiae bacterium]|nr:glycosyltransferase family 4 protein [Chlamydiota bacterium]